MTRPVREIVLVASLLVASVASTFAQTDARPPTGAETDGPRPTGPACLAPVDPAWLDRLPGPDRAALDAGLGYAPPELASDLQWPQRASDAAAPSWTDWRGRVVVVQTFTTQNNIGRLLLERLGELRTLDPEGDDLVLLAIHTPPGADRVERFLELKPQPNVIVAADPSGAFCDAAGFYRRPANTLVDRNGTVRYAGLNPRGLEAATGALLAETHDPDAEPTALPTAEATAFPTFTTSVGSARDVRGKPAPNFHVESFITATPRVTDEVVLVEFWGTWCGPCVKQIPHMNQLANQFRGDVVVIGISNEPAGTVKNFMRSTPMNYYVAQDQRRQMMQAIGANAYPHAIVMSSDWVVRWQGHPSGLNSTVLQQIVAANRAHHDAGGAPGRTPRWRK